MYFDIPEEGVTIAQVHNRGGSGNKPFFRLVLYENRLETVIRRDPEVSSRDTSFSKINYQFVDGANYDESPLHLIVEKSGGEVHMIVEQQGVEILNESFSPPAGTRWITNSGIANGFYLKLGMYNDSETHTENLQASFTTVIFNSNDIGKS